jgi:hypothetical protein
LSIPDGLNAELQKGDKMILYIEYGSGLKRNGQRKNIYFSVG